MYLDNGLTEKQERFCNEYLVDYNGTRAAIRSGYSEDTAFSIASENLRKPLIRERIEELQDNIYENLSDKLIITQIWKIYKKAIEDGKLSDALKAQELLGKTRALFADKQIRQEETFEDYLSKIDKSIDPLVSKQDEAKKDRPIPVG